MRLDQQHQNETESGQAWCQEKAESDQQEHWEKQSPSSRTMEKRIKASASKKHQKSTRKATENHQNSTRKKKKKKKKKNNNNNNTHTHNWTKTCTRCFGKIDPVEQFSHAGVFVREAETQKAQTSKDTHKKWHQKSTRKKHKLAFRAPCFPSSSM